MFCIEPYCSRACSQTSFFAWARLVYQTSLKLRLKLGIFINKQTWTSFLSSRTLVVHEWLGSFTALKNSTDFFKNFHTYNDFIIKLNICLPFYFILQVTQFLTRIFFFFQNKGVDAHFCESVSKSPYGGKPNEKQDPKACQEDQRAREIQEKNVRESNLQQNTNL